MGRLTRLIADKESNNLHCSRQFRGRHQDGVTLIELIIALVIIGIAMATITSVVVFSFDAIKTNTNYAASIRTAESCYETLLSLHENNAWRWNQPENNDTPYAGCNAGGWSELNINSIASDWLPDNSGRRTLLVNACRNDNFPSSLECQQINVDGPSTWFKIPVTDGSNLELLVPND